MTLPTHTHPLLHARVKTNISTSACACHHVNMATLPLPATVGNNESLTSHLLRRASHQSSAAHLGALCSHSSCQIGFYGPLCQHNFHIISWNILSLVVLISSSACYRCSTTGNPPLRRHPSLTTWPHHSHHFFCTPDPV